MTGRRRTSPPLFLAARAETLRVLAVALAGLAAFAWRIGLPFADPRRVEWLFGTDDTAMFQIGWMFFRAEEWSWPLGRIAGYLYPGGATIALTDSLPLLALPGKLLAAVLPAPFHRCEHGIRYFKHSQTRSNNGNSLVRGILSDRARSYRTG